VGVGPDRGTPRPRVAYFSSRKFRGVRCVIAGVGVASVSMSSSDEPVGLGVAVEEWVARELLFELAGVPAAQSPAPPSMQGAERRSRERSEVLGRVTVEH